MPTGCGVLFAKRYRIGFLSDLSDNRTRLCPACRRLIPEMIQKRRLALQAERARPGL
jgi:hypothetical protein